MMQSPHMWSTFSPPPHKAIFSAWKNFSPPKPYFQSRKIAFKKMSIICYRWYPGQQMFSLYTHSMRNNTGKRNFTLNKINVIYVLMFWRNTEQKYLFAYLRIPKTVIFPSLHPQEHLAGEFTGHGGEVGWLHLWLLFALFY